MNTDFYKEPKMHTTKILGIVPYPEMKDLMLTIASGRSDVELEVYVGDYRDCIKILEENLNKNYEVILSRGGTAEELSRRIHYIPVVDISVSVYDLLAAVRLARGSGTKFAAVGFASLAQEFQKLKEYTGEDFPVYAVSSEEETIRVLEKLKSDGFGMTLCSVVAHQHSLLLGMPSILITSGRDCVDQAFNEAVRLSFYYRKMHEELYFYKNILRSHERQTVILQDDDHILFTTEAYPLSEELCENSRKEISLTRKYGKCSFFKTIGNTQYSVHSEKAEYDGRQCCALKFTRTRIPVKIDRHGISYTDITAVRTELAVSSLPVLFCGEDLDRLKELNRSRYPVLITGEACSYKSMAAKYLYALGDRKSDPLITINCASLGIAGWQFLLENEDSPLNGSDCTVLVSHLSSLDETKRMAFLSYIETNLFCSRNRVFFLHTKTCAPDTAEFISQLVHKTHCLIYEVPPLRERLANLDAYISIFLNRKNQEGNDHVIDMDPAARQTLHTYSWPFSYRQLDRVLERLYCSSEEGRISPAAAEAVLQEEDLLDSGPGQSKRENRSARPAAGSMQDCIDLSKPLEEITRSVVMKVLEECGGNQRAAARQLKISRTTLWRMLKE